jgi:hypothetical protein
VRIATVIAGIRKLLDFGDTKKNTTDFYAVMAGILHTDSAPSVIQITFLKVF